MDQDSPVGLGFFACFSIAANLRFANFASNFFGSVILGTVDIADNARLKRTAKVIIGKATYIC